MNCNIKLLTILIIAYFAKKEPKMAEVIVYNGLKVVFFSGL